MLWIKQEHMCITIVKEYKLIMSGKHFNSCFGHLSHTHTHTHMYRLLTLRRGKRKPLSKLWCETGDWGSSKGMSGREKQREREGETGGVWHGKTLTRLLQGIARRLLIRTPANEVQGHWVYTNPFFERSLTAADVSPSRNEQRAPRDLMKNRLWSW